MVFIEGQKIMNSKTFPLLLKFPWVSLSYRQFILFDLCTMFEVDRNLLVLSQQCVGTSSPRLLSTMVENLGSETYKYFIEAPSVPAQGHFTPATPRDYAEGLFLKIELEKFS